MPGHPGPGAGDVADFTGSAGYRRPTDLALEMSPGFTGSAGCRWPAAGCAAPPRRATPPEFSCTAAQQAPSRPGADEPVDAGDVAGFRRQCRVRSQAAAGSPSEAGAAAQLNASARLTRRRKHKAERTYGHATGKSDTNRSTSVIMPLTSASLKPAASP